MRTLNAESVAVIDGADAEEDAALDVVRARQRQRQGAGSRGESEMTPPAAGGFSLRGLKRPAAECMPSSPFATMYVPSAGVALLPALQHRPLVGYDGGERMHETSGSAFLAVNQPRQQQRKSQGEQRYAGVDGVTSAIYANQQQLKQQVPTKRKDPVVPLAPLLSKSTLRLDQQAAVATEKEARVASTMTAAMERMEGRIPLSFLLQRQHIAFAERVALRAMCAVLHRHYTRVRRVCFGKWVQRTVTLRVLEQLARQEAVTRHAALAHACAIVQRKVQVRLLGVVRVWHEAMLWLRAIEHETNALVLQRSWRRYSLVNKLRRLALVYRARHRDHAATRIQTLGRMFLAKKRWSELVIQHQRSDAARCIQDNYRSYLVRRIAWKKRRVVASADIQRVWRGFRGRQVTNQRRLCCHDAVKSVFESQWLPVALSRSVDKWEAAGRIQRWYRVRRFRWQIAASTSIAHRRRRFFPAWRVQQVWKHYRLDQVRAALADTADRTVALFEDAARTIQQKFSVFIFRKKTVGARRLVMLFRRFHAKRVMVGLQMQWLQQWRTAYLRRWLTSVQACNPSSVWMDSLLARSREIDDVTSDQRSPLRRLHVVTIFKLMRELREFRSAFEHSHATQIQCRWRWHRLLILVDTMRSATLLLQRAIPPLLRMYTLRRRRRRVLARWKRERHLCMRNAFGRWKSEHLFLMHTHDLERASAKVRKAKWFRHLKLRKRMMRNWRDFVQRRRHKASRLAFARGWYEKRLVCRVWRAWTREAAPILVAENVLSEQGLMLHAWRALQQRRVDGLKKKRAIAWRNARVKRRTWGIWRLDLEQFRAATADATHIGDQKRRKRALLAWAEHLRAVQRVAAFHRRHACANGIRQWVLHMCLVHQFVERNIKCERFIATRITRGHWRRWQKYVEQRRAGRQLHLRMDEHHAVVHKRQAIRQWHAFTPILCDIHVTEAIAEDFSAFRIKHHVFTAGFRAFWAMTAGVRRIAMAIRIQRSFRARRARQKLFVLRTKIRYQIDTLVNRGADVTSMSGEQLMDRLRESKDNARELWVFALLFFPWQPLSQPMQETYNRVATNWTYLRKQRMCFALVDATETVKHTISVGLDGGGSGEGIDEFHHTQDGFYSLMNVFALHASQLPCIVAFWLGSGHGVVNVPVVGYTDVGTPILKRRYERVCGERRRESLAFSLNEDQDSKKSCSMAELMQWIESLLDDSRAASATDLQAYARGFLARRHFKRLRVLHNERLAQRIREWVAKLQTKWVVRKTNRAAMHIQRWQRRVHTRRLFWERLHRELNSYRDAARRVQVQYRRHLFFRRIRDAIQRRRATPTLFPNAPLCEECLGGALTAVNGDTASLDTGASSKLTLADVACRDCRQALCECCAIKLHSAGKRARHVFQNIDVPAISDPACVMCSVCEVAKCVRACQTCAQDDKRQVDPVVGNLPATEVRVDAVLTCRLCFELRHCKPSLRKTANLHQQKRRCWWQADAFRCHQWRFVRDSIDIPPSSSANGLTSRMVVDKYGWTTMESLERAREERLETLQSQQKRSDQLFAIRVQNEAILRDVFDRYDADKSGAIDRSEFRRMFREELCQPLSEAQINRAMAAMDRSGNGLIEFDELLAWFAEDLLEKTQTASDSAGNDSSASLALLKKALKPKRQMRRYKERLLDALPLSPLEILADKKRRRGQLKNEEEKPPPVRAKVPGFPSVECLEPTDFGAKRRVFFRFLHDICGIEWVLEDESIIPISDASVVFTSVFVPRWNAGKLTHDFYFDGEAFEFDGEQWERRWDVARMQFGFHTRRRREQQKRKMSGRRRSSKGLKRESTTSVDAAGDAVNDIGADSATSTGEHWEDVVEWIDPRRRQQLLNAAKEAFQLADRDASGYIDARKFRRLLSAELCEPLSSKQARRAFEAIDTDGSGTIDFDEFFQWYAAFKSQDAPPTQQEERARALLKTKRRAKQVAQAVVENAGTGANTVKNAVSQTLFEQQLAREKKRGAPPELLQLMTERHAKPLALKALLLNGHDPERARAWLEEKRGEQEQEAIATATTARERKQRRWEARLRRRKTFADARTKLLAALSVRRGKTSRQAHTARLKDAVADLDREILQVERQATIRHVKGQTF